MRDAILKKQKKRLDDTNTANVGNLLLFLSHLGPHGPETRLQPRRISKLSRPGMVQKMLNNAQHRKYVFSPVANGQLRLSEQVHIFFLSTARWGHDVSQQTT